MVVEWEKWRRSHVHLRDFFQVSKRAVAYTQYATLLRYEVTRQNRRYDIKRPLFLENSA